MKRPRLLLFDIDGTMLTCRGKGLRAMHRVMQALWDVPPVETRIEPQGKTDPMLFEEVGAAYGLLPGAVAARLHELQASYVGALAEELQEPGACEVKTGVTALLERLRPRPGVTLGIVSGNLEATAWLKLRAAGLDSYFDGGAFGSDSRRRADLVRLAVDRFCERTGVAFGPRDVWVIGDTPDDVAGGRAHGTCTLAVATGSFPRGDLERCNPDVVFDDFAHTAAVVDALCGER